MTSAPRQTARWVSEHDLSVVDQLLGLCSAFAAASVSRLPLSISL